MARDKITGKYINSATHVDRVCENCGVTFQIKESRLKHGGGKCCSRLCVDLNKKKTYKGSNNPAYGTKLTEHRKLSMSEQLKAKWQDPDYRATVVDSLKAFRERAANDGTWNRALAKRIKTMLENYGIEHNWNGIYGERSCDKTFINRYGMKSYEHSDECIKNAGTSIELKTASILTNHNIVFIPQHRIGTTKKYKFDFFLPEFNMVVECDGDYWHGKDLSDDELNETQIVTRHYDNIKNKTLKELDIVLVRFWESDINKNNYEEVLIQRIWQK